MENIIISACLCGINSKYNGGNNKIDNIDKLKEKYNLIYICPELFGGLGVPREPAEIKDGKVVTKSGKDVSANFIDGALKSLEIALKNNVKVAILKESSPSCGSSMVYDGTFSGNKVSKMGIAAEIFKKNNIKVYNETQIELLIK